MHASVFSEKQETAENRCTRELSLSLPPSLALALSRSVSRARSLPPSLSFTSCRSMHFYPPFVQLYGANRRASKWHGHLHISRCRAGRKKALRFRTLSVQGGIHRPHRILVTNLFFTGNTCGATNTIQDAIHSKHSVSQALVSRNAFLGVNLTVPRDGVFSSIKSAAARGAWSSGHLFGVRTKRHTDSD